MSYSEKSFLCKVFGVGFPVLPRSKFTSLFSVLLCSWEFLERSVHRAIHVHFRGSALLLEFSPGSWLLDCLSDFCLPAFPKTRSVILYLKTGKLFLFDWPRHFVRCPPSGSAKVFQRIIQPNVITSDSYCVAFWNLISTPSPPHKLHPHRNLNVISLSRTTETCSSSPTASVKLASEPLRTASSSSSTLLSILEWSPSPLLRTLPLFPS